MLADTRAAIGAFRLAAQIGEVAAADFVNQRLQSLAVGGTGHRLQRLGQIGQSGMLGLGGGAIDLGGADEITEIAHGIADQLIQPRMIGR